MNETLGGKGGRGTDPGRPEEFFPDLYRGFPIARAKKRSRAFFPNRVGDVKTLPSQKADGGPGGIIGGHARAGRNWGHAR